MRDPRPSIQERKAAVKARLPISGVIEKVVKLSGSAATRNRRGKCPFHNGNSPSFSIKCDDGYAHCFGCQWNGDVIRFVMDFHGLTFVDALEECEKLAGLASGDAMLGAGAPVLRERNPTVPQRRKRIMVEPIDMGRWIWKRGVADLRAVRRYFAGRGVPEGMLADARLQAFRYVDRCPCTLWEEGTDPGACIHAPAVVALVHRPSMRDDYLAFVPVGVHVTYLAPDGESTMRRRKPWARVDDEDPWLPKRRMLGPVGSGAVLLGAYQPRAHLYIGEGNETVFSGMGLAQADDAAVGVATLSLDNLQGYPRKWNGGIWPLHAIEPDADRPGFRIPGHIGPVTGLVDSDMSPLGKQKVVERKGGPIVDRAITGAERAQICAELFVKGWRRAGVAKADAMRAPLGMDFNDVVRSGA